MGRICKTPEAEIIKNHRWWTGTVTNDSHKIETIGFESPQKSDMFAIVRHKPSKAEFWFRTEQKLNGWLEKQPEEFLMHLHTSYLVEQNQGVLLSLT